MAVDLFGIGSEELAAISAAPITFLGAVGLVGFGIWVVMRWRYRETINKLKERVEHRDDEIARLTKRSGEQEERAKAAEAEVKECDRKIDELVDEAIARDAQMLDQVTELQKVRADLEIARQTIRLEFVEPEPLQPSVPKPVRLERKGPLRPPRRLTQTDKVELRKFLNGVEGVARIVTDPMVIDAEDFKADFVEVFEASGWHVLTDYSARDAPVRGGLGVRLDGDHDFIPSEFCVALSRTGILYQPIDGKHEADVELWIIHVA